MFDQAIFLHNSSLLPDSAEEVQVGSVVGQVLLDRTALPPGIPWQGLLVIALDPLEKIPDIDRTDNIFVQYVRVNGTDGGGNWLEDAPLCRTDPAGRSHSTPGQECQDRGLWSHNGH